MKVLHVIPSIAPRYGGPSQAVLAMCAALRDHAGLDAQIAATDADGPRGRFIPNGLHPRLPLHLFPRTASESWKYSRPLAAWLNAHVHDFDVVHVHAVFSHATAAACKAARRAGKPVILRPCGMLSPYSLSQSRFRKACYWTLLERHNLASASRLHATSNQECDELLSLLPAARPVCLPLGVDPRCWSVPPSDGAFRQRFAIPADARLLLFLARLHSKKGLVDYLLPALAQLPPDVFLAVVGGDDPHHPGHASLARQVVTRLNLDARVVFTGPLDGDSKWHAFDDADLYVLPSRHENFGATAVEALARGTPSILSTHVQAHDLVLQAGAGLAAPLGVDTLLASVRSLLALDPAQLNAMGLRGRDFAKRELTWQNAAARLADTYSDMIA